MEKGGGMLKQLTASLRDMWDVLSAEVRRVFSDKTVLVVFFLATVVYPPLYYLIYSSEVLTSMPVAVVNLSQGEASKRFIHKIDATSEVDVAYRCLSFTDAQRLLLDHQVEAIFLFPSDYDRLLAQGKTAHICCYSDISSFLYYKNALIGGSNVLLDEMHTIELQHQSAEGMDGAQAEVQIKPIAYDDVKLYNPTGGYASYFIPALLLLVVHQTLFFGICVLCGDANENRRALKLIPPHLRKRSLHRVTFGRLLCFMFIYFPITLFDLWLFPHWLGLPQLGSVADVFLFLLPLVASIACFAMTFGNLFVRQRMSAFLCCLFFSVILVFLSGAVWPQSSMPRFWLAVSYLFPSTPGIQGYLRISSMGAALSEVRGEYLALWIQAGFYFITATLSNRFLKRFN